ncbi:CopD family protein [Jannaschia sp. Os4]|uniref:CopD family protein n=1 Tax=Jannaschia sp. Os4 TaxID=2807617 RepID=UPI0031B5BB40
MTAYDLAKAAHILSVMVWVAGMAVAAMALRFPAAGALDALKRFDRRVTTPAMLAAWGFGLVLATRGGWFDEAWMGAKIALVLVLSGLHGALTGRLRRRAWDGGLEADPVARAALPAGAVLIAGIVLLVVTKAL